MKLSDEDRHELNPSETDTHLLDAWTPDRYAGDYPPYINLTMVRHKGDVIMTVRLPTVWGAGPGEDSSIRFTREMWRELARMFPKANEVFSACDELDAMM
jgi:hypothetical protein